MVVEEINDRFVVDLYVVTEHALHLANGRIALPSVNLKFAQFLACTN